MTTRRNFLKKACMSGICICGFSSIAQSMGITALDSIPDESINKNEIDRINEKVAEIKKSIPKDFTNNQKLYLISQLLNEEFNNE